MEQEHKQLIDMEHVRTEIVLEKWKNETRQRNVLLMLVILVLALGLGMLLIISGRPVTVSENYAIAELEAGDVLFTRKSGAYEKGDVVLYVEEGAVRVGKIAATAESWVCTDESGNVQVDGENTGISIDGSLELTRISEGSVYMLTDGEDGASGRVVSAEDISAKLLMRIFPIGRIGSL